MIWLLVLLIVVVVALSAYVIYSAFNIRSTLFINAVCTSPSGSPLLTFDDGPIPEQTPWVVETLRRYGAKATFFCVGDNVRKHPDVFQLILQNDFCLGCHTMNHLQLWRTSWTEYEQNIQLALDTMNCPVRLFRPPHGQMSPWRAAQLTRSRFDRIVFWDVMPEDYNRQLSPAEVCQNLLTHVRPGSIIVLHDSIKAGDRMRTALLTALDTLSADGYVFDDLKNVYLPNK